MGGGGASGVGGSEGCHVGDLRPVLPRELFTLAEKRHNLRVGETFEGGSVL